MKRLKFSLPRFGLGVAAMFALASPAQAFLRMEFSQKVDLEKVEIGPGGQRDISFAEPEVVIPGDRLRYSLRMENRTAEPAAGLSFVNPIPCDIRFVGTDDLDGFAVSVDGGHVFGQLDELRVAFPGTAPRPATREDVTHVQWTLAEPLAAGAAKSVTFFGAVC